MGGRDEDSLTLSRKGGAWEEPWEDNRLWGVLQAKPGQGWGDTDELEISGIR